MENEEKDMIAISKKDFAEYQKMALKIIVLSNLITVAIIYTIYRMFSLVDMITLIDNNKKQKQEYIEHQSTQHKQQ